MTDENKLPTRLSDFHETGGGAGAVELTDSAKRREALKWVGAAFVGGLMGFAGGTLMVAPSDGEALQAGAEGKEGPVCARRCFAFEPLEIERGDTVRGLASIGLGIHRDVTVRLFGINAPEPAAKALAYEWARTGAVELCVEPRARDERGRVVLGDLCTRDSCLSHELRKAGHAREIQ